MAPFDADFDFVYAFTSEPVYTSLAGLLRPRQRRERDRASTAGAWAGFRLRRPAAGVLSFRMAIDVPLNHETMHSWGVELQPLLGTADSHRGSVARDLLAVARDKRRERSQKLSSKHADSRGRASHSGTGSG
jgi:hypothetical protein